jgi:hypothetical protein
MAFERSRRAHCAAMTFCRIFGLLGALALAACNTTGPAAFAAAASSTTVAFDSIDGPPRPLFDKLVQKLNAEAQERRLAVAARDGAAAYRVRGYLGASKSSKQSMVSWVWDVYDRDQQRVLRISGEEKVPGKHKDAWQALDDDAMRRIAQKTVAELSAYLASVENGTAGAAGVAQNDGASPEAAGIFRIPQDGTAAGAQADSAQKQRAASTSFVVPSEPPSGTN